MWPLRADSPRDKLERQRILWLAALVRMIGSSACKWSKKITGLGQSVKDKALEGSGQWLSLLRGKKWMKSLSLIPEIQYIEIPLSDSWITSWAQRTRWCQEICKCPGTQKGDLSPTHLFDLRLAKPLAGPLSKRLSPSGRPAQFQDFQAIQAPTGRFGPKKSWKGNSNFQRPLCSYEYQWIMYNYAGENWNSSQQYSILWVQHAGQ
jgi:hypothetical protein